MAGLRVDSVRFPFEALALTGVDEERPGDGRVVRGPRDGGDLVDPRQPVGGPLARGEGGRLAHRGGGLEVPRQAPSPPSSSAASCPVTRSIQTSRPAITPPASS
ncbi:MAG TPA: hypothetical protein VGH14_03250 [Solirubrobacterales bacterium]